MEIAEALLVSTSPCEPDRGSHGTSEVSTGGGRGSGNIEYSAQADLASGEGVRRSDELTRVGEENGAG